MSNIENMFNLWYLLFVGTLEPLYAMTNKLHPTFRSNLLDLPDKPGVPQTRKHLKRTIDIFIAQNERPEDVIERVHDAPVVAEDVNVDSEDEEHIYAGFSQRPAEDQSQVLVPQTKLEAELAKFLNRFDNEEPLSTVDVLQWWSRHTKIYPLLSRAVRKYFAVQATSCSSERTFSKAGKTVTAARTCLSTVNVNMIIYVKENLPKIKLGPLILADKEELDAETLEQGKIGDIVEEQEVDEEEDN